MSNEPLEEGFSGQEQGSPATNPRPSFKEKLSGALMGLRPSPGYWITPIIMYINIIIFIIMALTGVNIIEPDSQSLLNWGANFKPMTLDGEWWRLITNCFLHIGIVHLLMNMYALLYIGMLLEPQIGKGRFAAAYLLTGVAASVNSLWWNELTISAGASGAIFGMYGLFLALLLTNLVEKSTRKELLSSILIFVVYNLIYGMKGGIDNAAHIGGLVSGLLIGFAYYASLKKKEQPGLQYLTTGILTLLVAAGTYTSLKIIPNDIITYDQKINEFISNEELALAVFKLPEGTPDDVILEEIQANGLRYWNENIRLLDELDRLNLPDDYVVRNKSLREYCDLRIKSYTLIYKALSEQSDLYWDQIKDYNDQIEKIIDDLNQKQ
jgi:rhomboid protease GluP